MGTIQLCEACRGIGNVRGKKCRTCGGFGAAAQLGESKLFWSRQIDFAGIAAARFQRIVRVFVSLVAISIFCISIGFVAGLLINNNNPEFIFQIAFWKAPSPSLFWLWTGALTGLYLISRSMRASEGVRRVPRRKYKQAAGELAPVSFEELRAAHRSGRIAIDQAFSAETLRVIERAFELANRSNHAHLLPMHLVQASLKTTPVQLLFGRMGIAIDRFAEPLGRLLERQPARQGKDTEISPDVFTVLFEAYQLAYEKREPMVRSLALFDAAVHADANVREILFDLGVEEETLLNVGAWIRISELLHERYRKFRAAAATRPKGGMDRAMTAMATPNLDQVSRDLTRYAAAGVLAPLINREDELAEMFRIFEGGASGVLLVGQPGVGKRALVEGLAQRMVEEDVPAVLSDKRMVELSVAELVSGVDPSAAQKRLLTVLSEVARAGNIVLVIPDAGGMVGVSVGEGIDLADAFAGELQKGYFQCIATATEADYAAKLEQNALGRSLERIRVEELSEAVAIQVLEAKSGAVEARQRVYFSYAALERAVRLSARYLHERFLPEKAIEIMTEAATSVRATRGERQIVSGEDVATIISQKTHVPVTEVTVGEAEKLLDMESRLHERVIGQDEAVKAVAAALRRARAELREAKRPIANFLFLGPTGVGKTELAKAVAAGYFGSEEQMIRLDMSEYQEQLSISRLIGAPGDAGGGVLTEAVRKQPFSLLLLDELEKAHKDILNLFLQVMDDGRLTDNTGRTIDFTNVILIATSNAGTPVIQEEIKKGTSVEAIKDKLINETLQNNYRPEFLNRFDGIIVFRPLTPDEILQITWLLIGKIKERLEAKGILLEVEDAAAERLAQEGFDPVFGARPLRRVIQDKVENALANFLLKQTIGRRDVVVFKADGSIEVRKAAAL